MTSASNTKVFWEERSKKYKDKIEGVLPKSFPPALNGYLDEWMHAQVKSVINSGVQLNILDLGCGYGRLSSKILSEYPQAHLTGIDLSQHYVDLYNKHLSPKGHAQKGDITKLNFPKQTFDVVFMVTTLMYLTDKKSQAKAMKEIFRVLKPDGKFVFIERNLYGYKLVTLGGLVDAIRGETNKEIAAVSFKPDDFEKFVTKNNASLDKMSGIPILTVFLPLGFLISYFKLPGEVYFYKIIKFLDLNLSWLLTPSLYISYIGSGRR